MSLSEVEIFYIEGNRESLSAEELSKVLKKRKTTIEKYLKDNPAKKKPKHHFDIQNGAVSMTAAQSFDDDSRPKAPAVQDSDYKKCIHKIDEDAPIN